MMSVPPTVMDAAPAPGLAGTRIGVLGLGRMGHAFAANLIADDASLTGYDRKAELAAPLAARGAATAKGLADFAGCDIVLTSLPDDDAERNVVLGAEGLAGVLRQGAIHVSMSTIGVALSRELAQAHRVCGQGFVAAPVLGNPDLAAARQLFVLAGGAEAGLRRSLPVLERLDHHAEEDAIVTAVEQIATSWGVPPAQVALAWLMSRPGITAPIIGASGPQQLDDAVVSLSLTLTCEEVAMLEAPYRPRPVVGHE